MRAGEYIRSLRSPVFTGAIQISILLTYLLTYDYLLQKNQTFFWKTWKAEFTSRACFSDFIDDSNNASVIADTFACMFERACGNNSRESNKRLFCEFTTTQDEYFCNYKYDDNQMFMSVEHVDKCLHTMKLGKVAGCDGMKLSTWLMHILF